VRGSNEFEPHVIFDWGVKDSAEKFMHIDNGPNGLSVTVHPGLSYQQVSEAVKELGEYGPTVLDAWQRRTGFTSQAS